MKVFFKAAAVLELILGGVYCLWLWFHFHDNSDDTTKELVISILVQAISICIFAGILYAVSIILDNQEIMLSKLATIQEATTGKPNNITAAHERLQSMEGLKEPVPENMWKCPECGKLNGNFTDSCGCGAKREQK